MISGKLRPEFVEYVPDTLAEGVLYVSIPYATVVHLCCCGCGNEVVTPLSPTDWRLTFDGESISLFPSIGNWSFPCQSHYWIQGSHVRWAERWSSDRIAAGRAHDRSLKAEQFGVPAAGTAARAAAPARRGTLRTRISRWLGLSG